MKRVLFIVLVAGLFAVACATDAYQKAFVNAYKLTKTSKLAKAKCMVCHDGSTGGKLNPYGKDLEKALTTADQTKLTEAILRSVEKLDSNKNGLSNLKEIKADKLPGAPKRPR